MMDYSGGNSAYAASLLIKLAKCDKFIYFISLCS